MQFKYINLNILLSTIALLFCSLVVQAQSTTGTLVKYSTIKSIGFEWPITGDTNHNATATVKYRINGSATWLTAQNLFRVDFQGYDMLAGSILFLNEATEYQVQISFVDPDGGSNSIIETIMTKATPSFPIGGNNYYVIPDANGNGDGTELNPFHGIAQAQGIAQAGDTFWLHAGNYGTGSEIFFNKSGTINNPILWRAVGDGDAILDVIRIQADADYVWFHELNFNYNQSNGAYGVRTTSPGPTGVVFTRNNFNNCHYCIYLNQGGDNWYIADNTIIGDNDPNNGSDFSGEGIELEHTSGHTVAYNKISRVADGISYPHSNVDIYGNDIFDTTDDGIEGDYGHNNIRIWGNRISNTLNNGISFQPMDGAPWYVLYNQVAAPNQDTLKLRTRTDSVLLAHNTLVAWSGGVSSGTELLKNFQSNNNLWISIQDRYAWEDNSSNGAMNWKSNLDYDGFDWGNYNYAFKWNGVRLDDIPAFTAQTGQQSHAIQIDHQSCFENFNIPNPPPAPMALQYLTLDSNCNAIDAGIPLPNINNSYLGSAPDLGAYEWNQPLPHYGPRSALTDIIFRNGFD
jgi:hypothetical protein